MKSFLVDALRRAEGQSEEADADKRPVDASQRAHLQVDGLADAAHQPDFKALELRNELVEEMAVQHADTANDNQFEIIESSEENKAAPLSATAVFSTQGGTLRRDMSLFARAGRMSPVLCLVAMATAAGGYVLLGHLASTNLNEDLTELSERFRSGSRPVVAQGRLRNYENAGLSVVQRIPAPNAQGMSPLPAASGSAPAPTGTRPETDSSKVRTPVAISDSQVRPGVTKNSRSVVNDRAYALVLAAFNAYRQKNYALAEEQYRHALALEPYHRDALAGLAAVFRLTARDDLALDTYKKLLAVDPGNVAAATEIISLGSMEPGWTPESDLKHLLQRFPQAHHLHFALGSLFAGQGRWADARYEFLAAHQLAPGNADYSFNLAVSLANLGEYVDARRFFEAALATAGSDSNIDRNAVRRHLVEMTSQLRESS